MHALVLVWVSAATVVAPAPPGDGLDHVALLGLVRSADAARSSAVLRVGARTRVVGVGDQVHGARVVAIDPGLLVLDDGGRRHELRLSFAAGPPAATPTAPAPETSPARDEGRAFARDEVERRIAEETPRLLSETALIPVSEDGRVTGFTLSRLPENSLLTDLGLQAGDVLTEINGTAVDSMATLLALYARLRNESEIRALVLRGGSQVPLVVRLR